MKLKTAVALFAVLVAPGIGLAAGYQGGPVSGAGTVSGKISFTGTAPEPQMMAINKDMEVCGEGHRMHQTVRVDGAGGLGDVVVFIEGLASGKPWPAEDQAPRLLQKDCAFRPYLQGVQLGTELDVKNGDPVSHNIHTYEIIGRARVSMFNVQQPGGSEFKKKIRMRRARVIRAECDQHDFMIGWLYAVENPYYTLTSDDGTFSLADVPAGSHKLKAWHPYLGFQEAQVTVASGAAAEVTLQFK